MNKDDSMDIDKDNIDDLIDNLNKISFFSDKKEYMKLHDATLIELDDIEDEDQFNAILKDTLNRYQNYQRNIIFTDNTQQVQYLLDEFIELHGNHDIDNETLFNLMRHIDLFILDLIHSSETPRFWLN